MHKTVLFVNPFDEGFTHTWDKEPYTIAAGGRMYVPEWLGQHLAKHLVDRELNKLNLSTAFVCSNPNDPRYQYSRERMEAKCIIDVNGEANANSLEQEVEMLNRTAADGKNMNQEVSPAIKAPFCMECDSKGVKHKKDCPKASVQQKDLKVAEEFAGLQA